MQRPLGRLLISKILETKDLRTCIELRFDAAHHLQDIEDSEIFDFIVQHYNDTATYHQVPSVDLVADTFPSYRHDPPDDSVASLCVQLFKDYVQRALDAMTVDVADLIDTDPYAALEMAREQVTYIAAQSTPGAEDIDLSASAEQFLEQMANGGTLAHGAIPWPWPTLNEELGGIHRGDYVSIYGRPGTMKTWLAMVIAVHAYMEANATVLFYSREMGPDVLRERAICRMLRMDYRKFRKRALDPVQRSEVEEFVRTMHGDEIAISRETGRQKKFIITSDYKGEGGGGTVDSLQLKVEEYEPDLIVVDGVYLMRGNLAKRDRLDWKNVYGVSQDLRATASKFEIPVIVTNQAKQSAAKTKGSTEEQAFADAFNQDVDLMIRVIMSRYTDDDNIKKRCLKLMFPKMRESGLLKGLLIGADPGVNFEEIRALLETPEDDEDSSEEEEGRGYEQTRGRSRVPKKSRGGFRS